jgi:hypothetical protein
MLSGTVLDRVSSINDLGVIMDEKMTFSEHVDVMVAKAFAMLGFIRRLPLEFRDPHTLKSLYTSLVRSKLEYASCVWNPFYDVCVDRVDRVQRRFIRYALRVICMICHHLRTDALFCILTPLQKDDRLLVWCLFSMFWVGEWTHQTCCPFSIWLHRDIRPAAPSFCVLISIERTMEFMNQCRVRCDSLMKSLVCLISVWSGISFWIVWGWLCRPIHEC